VRRTCARRLPFAIVTVEVSELDRSPEMRNLSLVCLCAVLAGCGTPSDAPHIVERERRLVEGMRERYDFLALTQFLKVTLSEHPVIEGVDVTTSRLDQEWSLERVDPPSRMRSGDWVIWDAKQGDEEFILYFTYEGRSGKSVDIRCRRIDPDRFEVLGTSTSEWVELK